MSAEIDASTVGKPSAANDLVHTGAGEVPVQGGSSEYVGAFMQNDTAQKNAVEVTALVPNNRKEHNFPRVSSDVYPNHGEIVVDVPVERAMKACVDQPRNRVFQEQSMGQQTGYSRDIEEYPATLPVRHNWIDKTLPHVTTEVPHDYRNGNEPMFEMPGSATVRTFVDQPAYQPLEAHPMAEQTLRNHAIEEQFVNNQTLPSQIFKEQAEHPTSLGDQAVLPAKPIEIGANVKVEENVQIAETQQPLHYRGVVFEGMTYRTRVFDPNINGYVYIRGGDL